MMFSLSSRNLPLSIFPSLYRVLNKALFEQSKRVCENFSVFLRIIYQQHFQVCPSHGLENSRSASMRFAWHIGAAEESGRLLNMVMSFTNSRKFVPGHEIGLTIHLHEHAYLPFAGE